MAKQKVGVYDRVLECAKEEFLSRGFLDASLRTIAQEAETSTGSIYTRFGDKEGLFRALAEPVVDEFKAMFRKVQEDFHQFPEEAQRAEPVHCPPSGRPVGLTSTTTLMYSACCWTGPMVPGFRASWTNWWTSRWSTPTSTWRSSVARASNPAW